MNIFNLFKRKETATTETKKTDWPIKRIIIRKGFSHQVTPATLLEGELGFNVDDHKLIVGTKEGYKVITKVKVVDGVLCTDIDDRLIPLCIRWPNL